MIDVIREEPLGPGEKGRVAQALCRKAEELEVGCLLCLHVCTELAWRCLPAIRPLVPAPRGRPLVRPQPHR